MNIEDLWIGDQLHVKSINETGKFEGTTSKGALIVQLEIGTIEVTSDDVILVPDKQQPKKVTAEDKDISKQKLVKKTAFNNEIDLHMDALRALYPEADMSNALSFQTTKCREFLQEAIRRNNVFVTIIHGKGAGILRNAIEELLVEFSDHIFKTEPANKGGAMLVYFN